MAAMTPEQITAELTRKAAEGQTKASSAANQAQLDGIIKARTDAANAVQNNTQQPTTETAPPTDPYGNPMDLINNIFNAQQSAKMQAIKKARETALQGLNSVETQAKQGAYDNRNQADVVAMQNAQRLRQSMADMGLVNSGDNITAQSQGNAQRQGAIGSINQQEQNTLKDVMERRATINNNAAGDEQAILSELSAARASAMLGQFNTDRSFGLDVAGLTGNFNGQRTIAGQGLDWGKTMDTAGLTGNFNGQRTLAGQSFDFQKEQQEWDNNFRTGQFNWQKAQDIWERTFQEKNFAQSVKDAAASRGLQWAGLNQREKERIADQAWREKTFNADQGWKEKQFGWETSPNNPSNMSKVEGPSTKDIQYDYSSKIGQMNPESRKLFFTNEQAQIVKDLGIEGFNSLYGLYYDSNGFPRTR